MAAGAATVDRVITSVFFCCFSQAETMNGSTRPGQDNDYVRQAGHFHRCLLIEVGCDGCIVQNAASFMTTLTSYHNVLTMRAVTTPYTQVTYQRA